MNIRFGRAWSLPTFIQRLSARERLLVASLGAIALVLLPLKALDWEQTGSTELTVAQVHLAGAQQAARGGQTLAFSKQILAQRRAIHSWAWMVPSRAVGRVLLENQIATLALQSGMTAPDVKTSDIVSTVGGLDFIRLDVSAPFDWLTLSKFLTALSDTKKGFLIDAISSSTDTSPKVRLVLRVPITVLDKATEK